MPFLTEPEARLDLTILQASTSYSGLPVDRWRADPRNQSALTGFGVESLEILLECVPKVPFFFPGSNQNLTLFSSLSPIGFWYPRDD
jgi:hypothetical protein